MPSLNSYVVFALSSWAFESMAFITPDSANSANQESISATKCTPVISLDDYPEGAADVWDNWVSAINEALEEKSKESKYEKCFAGNPAFQNLYLDGQEMLCSMLNTGFNTRYAATTWGPTSTLTPSSNKDFINQANRGSCGVVGTATMLADKGPGEYFETLFDLYCLGKFFDDKGEAKDFQPRDYLLTQGSPDPTSPNCMDAQQGCPTGVTYMLMSALRDSANVMILSKRDQNSSGYNQEYNQSLLSVYLLPPDSDNDVEYGSTTDDVLFMCSQLDLDCTDPVVGACGDDESCRDLLATYPLLPTEVEQVQGAVIGGSDPELTQYAQYALDELSKETPDLKELYMAKYVQTLSTSELTQYCNAGVLISIDSKALNGISNVCPDGISYGCGGESSPTCTIGESCSPDHWVYLYGCSDDKQICTIWTWGKTFPIECSLLAGVTSAVVDGQL